jgi:hypothetical protein
MLTISKNVEQEQAVNKSIAAFFKINDVSRVLKEANAYKRKGIPAVHVFLYLIQLVFTKKSMYMNMMNGTHGSHFARDVVYRPLHDHRVEQAMPEIYTCLVRIQSAYIASPFYLFHEVPTL